MDSPIGVLKLVASQRGLAGILWKDDRPGRVNLEPQVPDPDHRILASTHLQLTEYFAGRRRIFDVPLEFTGTDFQKAVWHELLRTPFGTVRTYADVAKAIGRPTAVRAVGAANGRNPIAIIAPCHRIIGSDGSLTGFAGGVEAKARLLSLESHGIRNADGAAFGPRRVVGQ